jgi:hypothetical protein
MEPKGGGASLVSITNGDQRRLLEEARELSRGKLERPRHGLEVLNEWPRAALR